MSETPLTVTEVRAMAFVDIETRLNQVIQTVCAIERMIPRLLRRCGKDGQHEGH